MKKISVASSVKTLCVIISLFCINCIAAAQDKVTIDTGEAKSWLSQNWLWVAGAALLLIIIIGATTSSSRRSTTTTRDNLTGSTTTTTTVEED